MWLKMNFNTRQDIIIKTHLSLYIYKRHKHTECLLESGCVVSRERNTDLYPISLQVGKNVLLLTVCREWLLNKFLLVCIWCRNSSIIGKEEMLVFIMLHAPPTWGQRGAWVLIHLKEPKKTQEWVRAGGGHSNNSGSPTSAKGFGNQWDRQSGWSLGERDRGLEEPKKSPFCEPKFPSYWG